MRKAIICGGREYKPTFQDFCALRDALWELRIICLVHGDARGVDRWAAERARTLGFCVQAVPYRSDLGKAGGPVRNQEMVDLPGVVACLHLPGNTGTADCVRRATKAGLIVRDLKDQVVTPESAPQQQTMLFS